MYNIIIVKVHSLVIKPIGIQAVKKDLTVTVVKILTISRLLLLDLKCFCDASSHKYVLELRILFENTFILLHK